MMMLQLLWSFIQIGLLSIGGGYASLPMIKDQVVVLHDWLSLQEFSDILIISQMTPGPIAINAASFVGSKIGGIIGSLAATLGVVLPSFFIVIALAKLYYKYRELPAIKSILKGLRPASVALIGVAGYGIVLEAFGLDKTFALESIKWISVGLFIIAFIVLNKFKINPIIVMLLCGVASLLISPFIVLI